MSFAKATSKTRFRHLAGMALTNLQWRPELFCNGENWEK